MNTTTVSAASAAHDELLSALLRSPGYRAWRAQVEATRGCAAPVHLSGSSVILDRDGAVVHEHDGQILTPCGNRRESVCPACSARYAADAFHLVRAGLAGDDTKNIPTSVTRKPRAFLTLTAPSFGPVHARPLTRRGRVLPCSCGERHHPADPRLSTPVDPDAYNYTGAVLWQAHAGALWARFTTRLRRALAAELGVKVREFRDHARLSYAKVAEYQRRGLVHFHAVIRLDGPDGPADPTPPALTPEALRRAVTTAARAAVLTIARPDGTPMIVGWGTQLDLRTIAPAEARRLEDPDGEITDASLAGYIAKYATKGTSATDGVDRPIREIEHLAHRPDISPHHARMIRTAWDLGGLEQYDDLGLRRWAHMLGFRGHFLTKSQRYSTTFKAIHATRATWRLTQTLAEIDAASSHPGLADIDPDDFIVINDWVMTRVGHHTDAERDLAGAIAECHLQRRSTETNTGRAA